MGIHNGLIAARNLCCNGFAQIDVQLQRSFELLPKLSETVSAYLADKREILETGITRGSGSRSDGGLGGHAADILVSMIVYL